MLIFVLGIAAIAWLFLQARQAESTAKLKEATKDIKAAIKYASGNIGEPPIEEYHTLTSELVPNFSISEADREARKRAFQERWLITAQ